MLWSLVKIILFICIIAGLTLGAGQLMDTGGGVRVAIGTIEFNLGPLQAVIAALVILAAFWIAMKIARRNSTMRSTNASGAGSRRGQTV